MSGNLRGGSGGPLRPFNTRYGYPNVQRGYAYPPRPTVPRVSASYHNNKWIRPAAPEPAPVVRAGPSTSKAVAVAVSTPTATGVNAIKPIVNLQMQKRLKSPKKGKAVVGLSKSPSPKKLKKVYKVDRRSKVKRSSFGEGVPLPRGFPRAHFKISKYSINRIRKKSMGSSSSLNISRSSSTTKTWRLSRSRKSSLSTISRFTPSKTSNARIARATRVLQKSKKILSKWRRKENTFCSFYSQFGSCGRDPCKFIHDPRQINICSTFISSGICSNESCTLSHNLQVGKIPICKFFKKGLCAKDSCPFRHSVAVSPRKKKQKVALKKLEKAAPASEEEEEEAQARYFEMCPDSQPIVSIIPRRLPKELAKVDAVDERSGSDKFVNGRAVNLFNSSSPSDAMEVKLQGGDNGVSDQNERISKRVRILEKVTKIKSSASMPNFLEF